MDSGDLVDTLPLITAVVDAPGVSVLLQRPVAKLRPCRPPFLGLGLLVPVGGGDGLALVLPLFRVIDFLPLRVKNVLLFLLRTPCAVLSCLSSQFLAPSPLESLLNPQLGKVRIVAKPFVRQAASVLSAPQFRVDGG